MNAIYPLSETERHLPAAHWRREVDSDGILWLGLETRGRNTNILSGEVLAELETHLETLERIPPRGLVIHSVRPGVFIAGADVEAFTRVRRTEEARLLVDRVHDLFNRIEALPCPVVAAINGACLGGGLELALACHYRVAGDGRETRLGLPEVQLGIHPGFGGTLRLPRLIGAPPALDLMLGGRTVNARRAAVLGLVDRVVPVRHLRRAARALVCECPPQHRPPLLQRLATRRPLRDLVVAQARRQLARKADPRHYPAPWALLELWRDYAGDPEALLRAESHSVSQLLLSPASRSLVRLFGLRERLRRLGRADAPAVRRVHVVGAGTMGADIASWCALQGLEVTVQDTRMEALGALLPHAARLFTRNLQDRRAERAALDRLLPDPRGHGLVRADLVIEAIVEDAGAKGALFRQLESTVRPDTLLATNTSSIPLDRIAAGLAHPGRLVGIHFFNPVARMPLVEVVTGTATAADGIARATAFVSAIDHLPLPVASRPGFLVNRILMPYLIEAVTLYEEGSAPEAVDAAARDFGMPVGPLELADTVGLDICLAVARELGRAFHQPVPEALARQVDAGHLGRKSGRGFHDYRSPRPRRRSAPIPAEISDRLILRLLNEAAACLREGVVEDADLLDAGIVFGTGFAPFRGGPLAHARSLGTARVRARLEALADACGERFRPDPGWDLVSDG